MTHYSLMFFIAYTFKGKVHVFTEWVKIVSHSSCRTCAIFKIFLSPCNYPLWTFLSTSHCVLCQQPANVSFFINQLLHPLSSINNCILCHQPVTASSVINQSLCFLSTTNHCILCHQPKAVSFAINQSLCPLTSATVSFQATSHCVLCHLSLCPFQSTSHCVPCHRILCHQPITESFSINQSLCPLSSTNHCTLWKKWYSDWLMTKDTVTGWWQRIQWTVGLNYHQRVTMSFVISHCALFNQPVTVSSVIKQSLCPLSSTNNCILCHQPITASFFINQSLCPLSSTNHCTLWKKWYIDWLMTKDTVTGWWQRIQWIVGLNCRQPVTMSSVISHCVLCNQPVTVFIVISFVISQFVHYHHPVTALPFDINQ